MFIVFDTTETFNDLRLEGTNFRMLKAYLSKTSSTLAIPKIVIEETVNHFRERLRKDVEAAASSLKSIRKLTGKDQVEAPVIVDQEEEVTHYRQHLNSQIKNLHGKVLGFEKVDIGELVQRSLQRRKPFDGEGRKGFRDAVIWETILRELLAMNSGATVALITKNTNDFANERELHGSLVEDCVRLGRSSDCVKLFDGLHMFIQEEVKPHLETLDAITEQLRNGQYMNFNLDEFIESLIDMVTDNVEKDIKYLSFGQLGYRGGYFHSPHLVSLIWTPRDVTVADVWSIDDDKVAVGIDFTVDGKVECFEELEVCYPKGDEVFSEFHDSVVLGDATFKVFITVILDKKTGETGNCEIDEVETELTTGWL